MGGNRYKWNEVDPNLHVTAVELDPDLCRLYSERFPNDDVIQTDAHEFLLKHYKDFDFIWASPPCPTHSRARFWGFGASGKNPVYPDMKLYQEIIFLDNHFKGKFVVENVIPYYKPLIEAIEIGRHLYWANFKIPKGLNHRNFKGMGKSKNELDNLIDFHEFDFRKYKGSQPINKIARNLVDYVIGREIFQRAFDIEKSNSNEQIKLFT